jgi:hypothetical protein
VFHTLRAHRHQPGLMIGLSLLMAGWLCLFISSTCLMSGHGLEAALAACPEHTSDHPQPAPDSIPDCSLKLCAEPPTGTWHDQNYVPSSLLVLLPLVLWLMGLSPRAASVRLPSQGHHPPDGRRIALIYRYCSLLI